jgi:hypothetical protein
MQRNGLFVLATAVLAAVAMIVAAYLFSHKPKPKPGASSVFDQTAERWHEERVTCLEGGGIWVHGGFDGQGTCGYSSVEAAASAVDAPSK